MDEAWAAAVEAMRAWLSAHDNVERSVLTVDIYGRIRAILWGPKQRVETTVDSLREALRASAGPWWSGDIWLAGAKKGSPVHAMAWDEGTPDDEHPERLRLLERHRNRGAWFADIQDPVWAPRGADDAEGPPVVVFYSFKGGLGRSTALASFAIQRARRGERVAVMDFDLDAPGVGLLLAADAEGRTSPWGTLDLLLERDHPAALSDYWHPSRRHEVTGDGELHVFPAGELDAAYPGKLARVDLEPQGVRGANPLASVLRRVRDELAPDWLLLDARTGLSEPAGALLSGVAHLHVLFGSPSEQSWRGLRVVIERLGARRVARGLPQADCLLVQAMVPADTETAKAAQASFEQRARDEFSDPEHGYYAEESEEAWDLTDLEADDAPHVPIPITYDLRLAHFGDVADVADLLAQSPDYSRLGERIAARFEEAADA